MSWDIFVQDLPAAAKSVADIRADFRPASIGKRSELVEKIKEVVPTADFSDPSRGLIDGDGWSIEVSITSEDCRGFALHVRGKDAAVGAVAEILQHLNFRALDSETGEFFVAGAEAIEAFRSWRKYRYTVMNSNDAKNG